MKINALAVCGFLVIAFISGCSSSPGTSCVTTSGRAGRILRDGNCYSTPGVETVKQIDINNEDMIPAQSARSPEKK